MTKKVENSKKSSIIDSDCLAYLIAVFYFAFFILFFFSPIYKGQKNEVSYIPFLISLFIQIAFTSAAIIFSVHQFITVNEFILNGELLENERKVMYDSGYRLKSKWNEAKYNANKAQKQFLCWWIFIWISWFFLYIAHLNNIGNIGYKYNISFFLNPLSNVNTFVLLFCYLILAEVTECDDRTGINAIPNWVPWFSLFSFIVFLEIMVKVFFANNTAPGDFARIFDWISGITSGAVMALLVGRFDTNFIKPRFVYLFFLYLYMAIQVISPVFMNSAGNLTIISDYNLTSMKLFISVTTLVGKIILLLFVSKLIVSRRLLFYFIRIRKLHYDVKGQWENFLKKNCFTGQTLCNNLPGLSTEEEE